MTAVFQLAPFPLPIDYKAPESLPIEISRDPEAARDRLASRGSDVLAVLTHSGIGIPEWVWPLVPNLRLIANFGAGLELIDLPKATSKGVHVLSTAHLMADDVADTALAFILALARNIPALDSFVKSGEWSRHEPPFQCTLTGRRLGIFGLGRIGKAIAERAVPFRLQMGYHSRTERREFPARYFPDLLSLAHWCNILVIAVPGGDSTRHAVDRAVLRALGRDGILVNVGRGSVVDEDALIAALQATEISGAGIDVFEHEPSIDARLRKLSSVLLTPHNASTTRETHIAMANYVYDQASTIIMAGRHE